MKRLSLLLPLIAGAVACDVEVQPEVMVRAGALIEIAGPPVTAQALDARCTANVAGVGEVDVESDYLPHVIACENGAASLEALKAQAVAARSYLYYKAANYPGTPIADGEDDQVYTCNNSPSAMHYAAVAATAGEVLTYQGTQIAAFYVAGAIPTADSCEALAGDDDYSETEHFVTYNWGRRGAATEQTTLGWVDDGNHANRGCKSQNAAHCLSEAGWDYEDILRFFYGMDVDLEIAAGECVARLPSAHGCGDVIGDDVTLIDDSDACFIIGCEAAESLYEIEGGEQGGALITASTDRDADCVGRWQLSFDDTGDRRVKVHVSLVPGAGVPLSYVVRHAGMQSTVTVTPTDEGWVDLGVFFFEEGRHQYVELADTVGTEGDGEEGPFVTFDAIAVGAPDAAFPTAPNPDGGVFDDAGVPETAADAGAVDAADAGTDDDYEPLPPSVQECACAAVPVEAPWTAMLAVLFTVLFARAARRRMPSAAWR
jgi:hypothetical protein